MSVGEWQLRRGEGGRGYAWQDVSRQRYVGVTGGAAAPVALGGLGHGLPLRWWRPRYGRAGNGRCEGERGLRPAGAGGLKRS